MQKLNAEYSGEISAYISTYRTECILGKKDVDATWDAYLAELDRLGYNEMMAELISLSHLRILLQSIQQNNRISLEKD